MAVLHAEWGEVLDGDRRREIEERVAAAGGQLVLAEGGVVLAVFPLVGPAVTAALALLGGEQRVPSRGALAAGAVRSGPDGLSGPALAEATRLCKSAGAGELLATEAVRVLAAGATSAHFAVTEP